MSTRFNSSHLSSPLRDTESLLRRRNLGEPSSLFDFEEVMNDNHNQEPPPQNDPPPMVRPNGQAPRTMEELFQNTCQFHGLPGDDANRNIDKFLEITQHMKQNGVSDDALRLSLFSYSLTHHAIAWYNLLPRNSIHSFDDMMRKFLSKCFPPSMVTKLRNEITKFEKKPHESLFEAWERYKLSIDRCPNQNMLLVTQIDTFYNGLTLSHWDTLCKRHRKNAMN
nr:reverse transcriptase domain-containing protein [Tanacetum cinerariifolium]